MQVDSNITKHDVNNSINFVKKLISEFEFILNHQDFFLDGYADKLKNKIDIHREELIKQIHKVSDELINKVDEYNHECKLNIMNIDKLTSQHKYELSELNKKLSNTQMTINDTDNNEKLNKILQELNQSFLETQSKIANYKNDLKLNKKCLFYPKYFPNEKFAELLIEEAAYKPTDDTGEIIRYINGNDYFQENQFTAIELIENEKIAVGCYDGLIKIFSINHDERINTLEGHEQEIISLKSISYSKLISCSYDGKIKIWSINDGICIQTLSNNDEIAFDLCITPNLDYLLVALNDATVKIWNLINNYNYVNQLIGHSDNVIFVRATDDNRVVTASDDRTIKIWNLKECKYVNSLKNNEHQIDFLELLSNKNIVIFSFDIIKIWNINLDFCLRTVNNFEMNVNRSIKFISDDIFLTVDSQTNLITRNARIREVYEWVVKVKNLNDPTNCIKSFKGEGIIRDFKMMKNNDMVVIQGRGEFFDSTASSVFIINMN